MNVIIIVDAAMKRTMLLWGRCHAAVIINVDATVGDLAVADTTTNSD
ncbi:hypothetical protein [Bacillus sp. LL01]|nr:hypothetical protein [Bacillus sp. LL01]